MSGIFKKIIGGIFCIGVTQLGAQTLFTPGGAVGTTSNANVGIGTSSPTHKFSLDSAGNSLLFRGRSAGDFIFALAGDGPAGSNLDLFSIRNNNTGSVHLNSVNGARLALGASSSGAGSIVETLTITSAGNVGIGTTNPTYKFSLDSAGNALVFRGHSAGDFIFALAGDGVAGPNLDLFSIRNNNTGSVHLNSVNGARLALGASSSGAGSTAETLTINSAGNVGIGTTNPTQKLSVNGTIRAKEVIVDTGWSDYVFDESYRLAPLAEIEQHIKSEKHLPGIPSAAEVAEHGVSMGDMQSKLLAKIEELTLHLIDQEKRINKLETENATLRIQK